MICINFYLNIFSILTVKSFKRNMNDFGNENFCYKTDMNKYDRLEEKITPIISKICFYLSDRSCKKKIFENPISLNDAEIERNCKKNLVLSYKKKYLNENLDKTESYSSIFMNIMQNLRDKQLNSEIQNTDSNSIINLLLTENPIIKRKIYQYYIVFSVIEQGSSQNCTIQYLISWIRKFYGVFIKAFCPNFEACHYEHLPQYLRSQYHQEKSYKRPDKKIESDKTREESKKRVNERTLIKSQPNSMQKMMKKSSMESENSTVFDIIGETSSEKTNNTESFHSPRSSKTEKFKELQPKNLGSVSNPEKITEDNETYFLPGQKPETTTSSLLTPCSDDFLVFLAEHSSCMKEEDKNGEKKSLEKIKDQKKSQSIVLNSFKILQDFELEETRISSHKRKKSSFFKNNENCANLST